MTRFLMPLLHVIMLDDPTWFEKTLEAILE